MKVKDLIEKLANENPESEVIIAKRDGGSPLSDVDGESIYIPENTWCGEIWSTKWSAYDACMMDEEWEEFKRKPRCVILYPL